MERRVNKQELQKILPNPAKVIDQQLQQLSNIIYQAAIQNKFLTNTETQSKRKTIKVCTPSILLLTGNDYDVQYLKDNLFTAQMLSEIIVRCVQEYTPLYSTQIQQLSNSSDVIITNINNLIYLKNKNIVNFNVLQNIIVFIPEMFNYMQQCQLSELIQQFTKQNNKQISKSIIIVNNQDQNHRNDNITQSTDYQNKEYEQLNQIIIQYQQILQQSQVLQIQYLQTIQVKEKQLKEDELEQYLQSLNENTLVIYNKNYIKVNQLSSFIYNINKEEYGIKLETYRQFLQSGDKILLCQQQYSFNSLDKIFDIVIGLQIDQNMKEECIYKAKKQYINIQILQ